MMPVGILCSLAYRLLCVVFKAHQKLQNFYEFFSRSFRLDKKRNRDQITNQIRALSSHTNYRLAEQGRQTKWRVLSMFERYISSGPDQHYLQLDCFDGRYEFL
jgi:hypothetical protein